MNRFSRLSALWASFYSRDLYRAVVYQWKGIGLVYLVLLLGICWLPSAGRWLLRGLAAVEAQTIVSQLPAIAIREGVMTASPSGRHVIQLGAASNSGSDEGLILIDDSIDNVRLLITLGFIAFGIRAASDASGAGPTTERPGAPLVAR